jgi:hypothetical protein
MKLQSVIEKLLITSSKICQIYLKMDSVLNLALLVFALITVSVLGSLVMVLLLGWIFYASDDNALTDQSGSDVTVPEENQSEGATNFTSECLKPEDAPDVEWSVHELDDVVVPFGDTISLKSEPLPPRTEETSPAVTLNNEPNDIPRLAQNEDEPAVASRIVQNSTDKEELLRVSPTEIMTMHSTNAAKSFQKLLQFAMSQGPSETDVSATSTQVEAATNSSLEQTDETTGSVARNQRSKAKSKKKNKRNKGRNAKK